ncbi:MAG: methylated-DNA--[protein]-cysteine S-methyltransferase [Firmicutes bacterium]|nr:methylated-DNA--[protein]-cysteine S-methyltransferase [Bacillota bacterium]
MTKYLRIDSPIGKLTLAANNGYLTNVFFEGEEPPFSLSELFDDKTDSEIFTVLQQAKNELNEYFEGQRTVFSVPLKPKGGEFFQRIWKTMCDILHYGQTTTYSELAKLGGNEKAARAVGMANNRNPIPIFIPCHRVLGKNKSLTGFRGGLDMKQKLLNIEGHSTLLSNIKKINC